MEKAVLHFEVALGIMGGAGIAAASPEETLWGQKRKTVMCMHWAGGGESLSLALPGMMAGDEDPCILKSFCLPNQSEAGDPH